MSTRRLSQTLALVVGACAWSVASSACSSDDHAAATTPDAGDDDGSTANAEVGIFCPPSGVSKGPWTLAMTRTSMKVRWEACKPGTSASLFVRPDAIAASSADREVASVETASTLTERHHSLNVDSPDDAPGTFYMHDALIDNLTAGSCYRYELGADRQLLGGRFCTAQPDGGKVHFLSIGDTNPLLGNATRNVLKNVVPRGAEFTVHGGDWQYYDSGLETWAGWFPVMTPMLSLGAMQPTLGNHEEETDDELDDYSLRFFGDPAFNGKDYFYRFETGGLQFIVIDTEAPLDAASPQGTWLAKALADAAATPGHRGTIITMHRPFITCGDSDNLDDKRAIYAPMFAANNVVLVLQAHMHGYERFTGLDGTTYVTSAGGGGKIGDLSANITRSGCTSRTTFGDFFNAVDFVADGKTLTGTAIDDKGAARDTFTIPLK